MNDNYNVAAAATNTSLEHWNEGSGAMLNGFDDAIVLNQDGQVSEGSVANFMTVRRGVVITLPMTANILEEITRRSLITLIREGLGVEVVERETTLCEAIHSGVQTWRLLGRR